MTTNVKQLHTTDTAALQRMARKNITWRDLRHFTTWDTIKELLLPLPFAVAAFAFAQLGETVHWGFLPLSLLACFLFFLAGLRLSHDAFHHNLGLSRRGDDLVLVATSVAMMISNHVVKFSHLNHHKHCMTEDDVEADSARMPWWQALLYGPMFPVKLHIHAWRKGGPTVRRFMLIELALSVVLVTLAFGLFNWFALKFFIGAMLVGECLTAFFAVWTVHHDTEDDPAVARTQRGFWKNGLTLNMFHHAEHHLFPGVPTRKLPDLAARIDAFTPELTRRRVLPEL